MPIIVDNATYERLIFDPEDIEAVFKVDDEIVEVEKVAELVEAGGKLEATQQIKDDAEPIKVTFRPLRASDKTAIEDTIQMEYGASAAKMAPGSMRRLAIKRAVVKWSYSPPFTDSVLDNLDPNVFEQLYGWISWGIAPPEQDTETGLPLEEEEAKPNRAQRRAAKKTKVEPEPVAVAAGTSTKMTTEGPEE